MSNVICNPSGSIKKKRILSILLRTFQVNIGTAQHFSGRTSIINFLFWMDGSSRSVFTAHKAYLRSGIDLFWSPKCFVSKRQLAASSVVAANKDPCSFNLMSCVWLGMRIHWNLIKVSTRLEVEWRRAVSPHQCCHSVRWPTRKTDPDGLIKSCLHGLLLDFGLN